MKHKEQENTYEIQARIYGNHHREYGHIYIDFFYIDNKNEKRFSFHELTNFQLSAQFNINDDDDDTKNPYAFRFETRGNTDMQHFREVYKLMSMVEKKYNKLCETFERPNEFYQYAIYILNVLGIKQLEYNDTYRQPNDLKYIINQIVEKESTPTYKINN